MLSLQLKSGEYLTIGSDIAVQVFEQSGSSFRVSVKAPREVPILRGEVLERSEARPDGLHNKRPKSAAERARDAERQKKLEEKRAQAQAERQRTAEEQAAVTRELRDILSRMDEFVAAHGRDGLRAEVEALRGRLDALAEGGILDEKA